MRVMFVQMSSGLPNGLRPAISSPDKAVLGRRRSV